MIHGVDTGILVAAALVELTEHASARAMLARLTANGDRLALAPQVLAEFIHVVTDSRRFVEPLTVAEAIGVADE